MASLIEIPIQAVVALSAERSVEVMRSLLRAECNYAQLGPETLTISSRLTVADGGIDAEISTHVEFASPADCMFRAGLTGFQIKSGTTFKPWTRGSIRGELLNTNGELFSEIDRLAHRRGRYVVVCTGHDLTPQQRNHAREHVAAVLNEAGHTDYYGLVDVIGASQLAEYVERYPGTASLLIADPVQEAWVLDVWRSDAHMSNAFETSDEQNAIIKQVQACASGGKKHVRVLGEPGLGKTRLVLEALKDPNISPYVLYFPHGSQFGQTKLFRQLLVTSPSKPLVIVIDELPEGELIDIWRHLKARCGHLRLVSLDHGSDETHDDDILRLRAPRLSDATIKQVLASRIGESRELDRWVAICEGSPRVAHAVADNLAANPQDLLRPPSTVPIWARFVHGYGDREQALARQIDCVTQHLALFSRFGYEAPVGAEARYVADLVKSVDQTIGWARFQEIVDDLRGRRVLQGNKTLFFVPKALHIYLWKQFWTTYGRGFDLTATFTAMPESLHAWFMNMFRYADGAAVSQVIDEILQPDGIYSNTDFLASAKGSRFLRHLAEARPLTVLQLLEGTLGRWTDDQLLLFKEHRQEIVWTLEKIAVWPLYFLRSAALLSRLAANENAGNANNSTGTFVGLFRVGPEAAATEASPHDRLPGATRLLRSSTNSERRLGLRAFASALYSRGMGYRIVGPEYQGLKERAKLWVPPTYGDWWDAYLVYFQALVDGVQSWPIGLRQEACDALLNAVENQIKVRPCTELAFNVLEILIADPSASPSKLNHFFWHWREYDAPGDSDGEISRRLRTIERKYNTRSLASRFQRYVLDVDWLEWSAEFRQELGKAKGHATVRVFALAARICRNPAMLQEIVHLMAPNSTTPALWTFGERLAKCDAEHHLLPQLVKLSIESKHSECLRAYLASLRQSDRELHDTTVNSLLDAKATAWLGLPMSRKSRWTFLFHSSIVRNGTTTPDQAHVISS